MLFSSILILFLSFICYFYFFPLQILRPVLWEFSDSLISLEGTWKKNNELKDTLHLNFNVILSPESISFDNFTGNGYASLSNGRIIEINKDGNYIQDLFFVGGNLFLFIF